MKKYTYSNINKVISDLRAGRLTYKQHNLKDSASKKEINELIKQKKTILICQEFPIK